MSQVKHIAIPRPKAHRRRCLWIAINTIVVLLHGPAASAQTSADETPALTESQESSAPEPTAAKTTPNLYVPARLAEEQRHLLSQLPGPPSSLWLPVGDEQVLAFWQADRSGKPLGAVLMLHDKGENPRRAATLRRLHEYLPFYGWATLSVELPDLPEPPVPPRPEPPALSIPAPDVDKGTGETEELTNNPSDEAAAPAHEPAEVAPIPEPMPPQLTRDEALEHIQLRIQAATSFLHQQGQLNLVLLGEGRSALWALQHLDKAVPPTPVESSDKKSKAVIDRAIRAVVLLNPQSSPDTGLDPLTEWLRHPEVPTFDVFTDLDLGTLAAARQRQQAAKQKRYEVYGQRRLPPPNGANPEASETLLTKAIRGFLQKHAKGVELK